MKNYDGPLYAPWSKVVEGRGFDPVEKRKKEKTSYLVPVLMFVGVIVATLSVIVAGYFHGNMHLITTLKNAANS
ncbi:hypothetical protein [Synechococcus phage S-8S53]|jgi:hypothetical protein|nr:hypothetical protein [Synechococcus phage S-8S53]WLW38005.1 hypothetical protein [Synechococcus phage S-8S56]